MRRFGPFTLDVAQRRLLRDGAPVVVQDKALDLLICLTGRPGALISRTELEGQLWPDVRVTDQSLRQATRRAREALDDDDGEPVYIETVPKQGLRFIARVSEPSTASTGAAVADRDAFVGRETELAAIGAALDAGARALTISGTGGIGKTRIARVLGGRSADRGSVWFCDLSHAHHRDGVVAAVAQAFDVSLDPGDPLAQLGDAIASRGPALVILDNAEQVAADVAIAVGVWLELAPFARFVVTSRQVLRAPWETEIALAPLPRADAIELFASRVQAAGAGFARDSDVDALVELLDHLPLAIELAAARVRVMSPKAIVERMRDRFRLLATTDGRPARHATLRATLDWSWALLDAAEQSAIAQLSVFVGTFSLDAAEAVLRVDGWAPDVVQSLVDKSLLVADSGQIRLLAHVRDYAQETLQGDRVDAETRHGRHFAGLDFRAAAANRGAAVGDLTVACQRAVLRGDAAVAVGALERLWELLLMRGQWAVAEPLARSVRAMPDLQIATRARADRLLGVIANRALRPDDAAPFLQAALLGARACGDRRLEGMTQLALGIRARRARERDLAVVHLREACELARGVGDGRTEAAALVVLAQEARKGGDLAGSTDLLVSARRVAGQAGEERILGTILGNLGNVYHERGRLDLAREAYETSIEANRQAGERRHELNSIVDLGLVDLEEGRFEEGRARITAGLAGQREVGNRYAEAIALAALGRALIACGQPGLAEARLDEAAAFVAEHRASTLLPDILIERGRLDELRGRFARAAVTWHQALDAARAVGDRRLEGCALGRLATILVRRGELEGARVAFGQAEALLRAGSYELELAKLLCRRASAYRAAGDVPAGDAALLEARTLAAGLGALPTSELGLMLASDGPVRP